MTRSLAEIQINLETLMALNDELEVLSDDKVDEFLALKKEREEKIDGWIAYHDHVKYLVEELKERKERFVKAYNTARRIKERINERIVYHIENDKTGIPFRGSELGTMYLANNSQPSFKHTLMVEKKEVYEAVNPVEALDDRVAPFLKDITFKVVDKEKAKAQLAAGVEIPWAKMERGKHVRVKGR